MHWQKPTPPGRSARVSSRRFNYTLAATTYPIPSAAIPMDGIASRRRHMWGDSSKQIGKRVDTSNSCSSYTHIHSPSMQMLVVRRGPQMPLPPIAPNTTIDAWAVSSSTPQV